MAMKYRKRIRLFPGFYLNLSKSGMSATVGIKGFSINTGQKGTYLNTGIPGTGLYNRTKLDQSNNNSSDHISEIPKSIPQDDNSYEIKSYQPESITSEGLFGLKEAIVNAQIVKSELKHESEKLNIQKFISIIILVVSHALIFGIFIKWFRDNYKSKRDLSKEAKEIYNNFKLDIDFNMDESIQKDYISLKNNFDELLKINTIWDITSAKSVNRVKERSAASQALTRSKVIFSISSLNYINTQYDAFKFQNANGGDLYFYPGFIVMTGNNNKKFGLIDYRDITITHSPQRFIESEQVPKDSEIVDKTWKFVNKNGSRDKRYKENYEIPIVEYYELTLESKRGLYESYYFSNAGKARYFCNSLETYKDSLQKMNWKNDEQNKLD